ncbi:MAG: endo-1,4-beta-xylanase [Planctomycetia bacterium]|nr:endo-1,4-beta-xylanase [Planctomycetia bacterium]
MKKQFSRLFSAGLAYLAGTVLFSGTVVHAAEVNAPFIPDQSVMSDKYLEFWNADVQKKIDAAIEKNRKADAEFVLENTASGTDVKVVQKTHQFRFGSNIFLFGQLDSAEKNARYADMFGTIFNSASVAFYWKTMEPEQGKPRYEMSERDTPEYWASLEEPWKEPHWRRPPTDPVVDFLTERGVNIHGHAIIYGIRLWAHPTWMPNDRKAMEVLFEKRVRELAERYGDRIQEWDVVNECIDQANRGIMPDDYTYKTFAWAKKYFPENVRLSTNECDMSWGPTRRYVEIARDLIDRGARVDLVGVQMHIFNQKHSRTIAEGANSYTPDKLNAVLDTLVETERPIHVSEITISAPDDTENGRMIQAVLARNLYRLFFAHPQVEAVTWWNAADGGAAPGEPSISGILDKNMNPKPVYYALDQLINHEWKTNLTVKTDADGRIQFRGFRGDYELTWTDANGNVQTRTVSVR